MKNSFVNPIEVELMQSMKESVNLKTDQYKLQNITQEEGGKSIVEGDRKRYLKTVAQY